MAFMLNPYFRDGTRLRLGPEREAKFSDQYILNDEEVTVLQLAENGFVNVRGDKDKAEGWVRSRNLTRMQRSSGLLAVEKPSPKAKLQRSSTISSLKITGHTEIEDQKKEAGLNRLMAVNGVQAGLLDEKQKLVLKKTLSMQAESIRKQLRRDRQKTLDPHSKFVSRWDALTASALLFTASVTPFEVCILPPTSLEEMPTDPLSWLNRIVDTIFLIDSGYTGVEPMAYPPTVSSPLL